MLNNRPKDEWARGRRTATATYWFDEAESAPDICGRPWQGRLRDLSEFGTCVELDRPLRSGCAVSIRVVVEEPPAQVSLRGEVRWHRPADRPGLWSNGILFRFQSVAQAGAWRDVVTEIRVPIRRTPFVTA